MAQLPKIVYGNGAQTVFAHNFPGGCSSVQVNNVVATFTDAAGQVTMSVAPAAGAAVEMIPAVADQAADLAAITIDSPRAVQDDTTKLAKFRTGKRVRIVSSYGGAIGNNTTNLSNGTTQVSRTDQSKFQVLTPCKGLQFVRVNGYFDVNSLLLPTGNAITVHEVVEAPSGPQLQQVSYPVGRTAAPVSAGGRTGSIIGDGEWALSAPTGGGVYYPGVDYKSRCYTVVGAGEKMPLNDDVLFGLWSGVKTTDFVYANTAADGTDQTTLHANGGWGDYKATGVRASSPPIAIIGEQIEPAVHVGIFGDSIPAGYPSPKRTGGPIAPALTAAGIGWSNHAIGGNIATTSLLYDTFRPNAITPYVDYIVFHIFTNDLAIGVVTTLDGLKQAALKLVRLYGHQTARFQFSTVIPRTTSSDAWATPANQTLPAWEAVRVAWNNFLRDPRGSGAVAWLNSQQSACKVIETLDFCRALETDAAGNALVLDANGQQPDATYGRWKTTGANSFTTDGIHTTAAANTAALPYVVDCATKNYVLF